MTVRGVGAPDLAGEVDQRNQFLGPGRQVAQTDLAHHELVADDDREVGLVASRRLQLLAELASPELGAGGDPRRSQIRDDLEPAHRVIWVGPTTTATGGGSEATGTPACARARINRSIPIPEPDA